ncbi:MAG: M60 family peptidase N-terminal accessory domain-containing protein [bacterium]
MKKIILILSTIILSISITGCSTKEDKEYTNLEYSTNQNNEYQKIIVNSLVETSRQEEVLSDPTINTNYDIPTYTTPISTTSHKTAILNENNTIFNYDKLDESGIYHLESARTSVELYKFRGSDTQLASSLLDDTAVSKKMTIRNSIYPVSQSGVTNIPVNMTGLYAPAGEVVKVVISEELAALNPIIYIGATSINGEVNNISDADTYTRMPQRVKQLTLTDTVNYIGSPLGGQIYIQVDSEEYNVEITGAVEYMHYIYNTTSRDELERLYSSTAPMIDIEVPEQIRINMPRYELTQRETEIFNELTLNLEDFNESEYKEKAKQQVIDEIIEVANYWKVVSEVSAYLCPEDLYRTNEVTIFFDSHVVSSYSEVGKNFSTFEIEKGRTFLNKQEDKITEVTAFNKHFWNNDIFLENGSNNTTANVLTMLSCMLYDTYGAYRTYEYDNHLYSSAGNVLNVLNNSNSGELYTTAKYATLIQSFGVHTFIEAVTTEVAAENVYDKLFVQFSSVTKLNMQYYFEDVLGVTLTDSYIQDIKAKNYSMYIPIASNLQIGQVIDGKNIYLNQAYEMYSFEEININESLVVPKGMQVKVNSVTNVSGNLVQRNGIYYYSTDLEEVDEFNVSATVYNDDYSYTVNLIFGTCVQYSNQIFTNSTTTLYSNVENTSLDEINYNDLSVIKSFPLANSSLQYSVDTGYNGVFVTYAELYFPTSKDYTLVTRGLGDMKISIGDSFNNLEEVIRFKQEETVSSYDKTNEETTHTISVNAYEKVCIKIEISSVAFNTYERSEFYLGYVNGTSVTDIPSDWWYGQYSFAPTVASPTATVYSTNISNLDELNESELTFVKTFTSEVPAFGNNQSNGYYLFEGFIVLPETKEYTFTLGGRGDIKVSLGTSSNDAKEVVRFDSLSTASGYDITDESRSFKINSIANEKTYIKVEIFDPQRGEFSLGYIDDNNVINLTSDYWYGSYTVPKEAIHYTYSAYNTESFYSTTGTISSYTSIDENLNIIYQTGKLDDKFLTTPNSDSQSMDPGSIVIYKYDKEVTANYFSLISSNDGEGILSFFEIYVSDNGVDWTEAFNGLCDYESTCALSLKSTFSFKYVKLVFLSQYSGNYINICNFEFQLRSEDLTVIDCPNNLSYIGNTNVVTSAANLNNNIVEFDNKIKFSVTGSTILLFSNTSSKYGEVEIKVNGVTYNVDLSGGNVNSKQILSLIDLEYGTYEIEITATNGLGNIDYIAVK